MNLYRSQLGWGTRVHPFSSYASGKSLMEVHDGRRALRVDLSRLCRPGVREPKKSLRITRAEVKACGYISSQMGLWLTSLIRSLGHLFEQIHSSEEDGKRSGIDLIWVFGHGCRSLRLGKRKEVEGKEN
jgi:hypothetical protein